MFGGIRHDGRRRSLFDRLLSIITLFSHTLSHTLQQGFLNGLFLSGSLLNGSKQAVAAVTGAYTTSAVSPSARQTQFTVLASYLGGSLINGALNPNGYDSSVLPVSLLASAALVATGYQMLTGGKASNLAIWSCLALANGCQNSWTSSLLAGNVLRSAHFSGITSDMGTFLGQILRGNQTNVWKLRIFAALAACFFAGGLLSVPAAREMQAQALWVSVAGYVALCAYLMPKKK